MGRAGGRAVQLAGGVLCALAKHRVRHLLFYSLGPGALAGLSNPDPTKVQHALSALQLLRAGFPSASAQTFPAAVAAVGRSCMGRPLQQGILRRRDGNNFVHVLAEVGSLLRAMFSLPRQSWWVIHSNGSVLWGNGDRRAAGPSVAESGRC